MRRGVLHSVCKSVPCQPLTNVVIGNRRRTCGDGL
jgi:hypothetical protein